MTDAHDQAFKALSDPTRRLILGRLISHGEQTVGQLTSCAGVSQPAVSKHLALLRQTGFVDLRRVGREAHYKVRKEGFAPITDWFQHYSDFWPQRFNALSDLLERMDQ